MEDVNMCVYSKESKLKMIFDADDDEVMEVRGI